MINASGATHRIQISNSLFKNGSWGIFLSHPGSTATGNSTQWEVKNNQFIDQRRRNLNIFRSDGVVVDQNQFTGKFPEEAAIRLSTSRGLVLTKNYFSYVAQNWSNIYDEGNANVYGDLNTAVSLSFSSSTDPLLVIDISNNILGPMDFSNSPKAMHIYAAKNANICHNTIGGLLHIQNCDTLNVLNNIILSCPTTLLQLSNSQNWTIDYNQYDTQFGYQIPNFVRYKYCPVSSCTDAVSLEAWQTLTGADTHSVMLYSDYYTDTDLHVLANPASGTLIETIMADIDNDDRDPENPLVGADVPNDIPFQIVLNESLNPTCANPNSGHLSFEAFGGTAPYSYLWDDGFIGASRDNLTTGTYQITITDDAGNTITEVHELAGISPPQIEVIKETSCAGGQATIYCDIINVIANPYVYVWNNGITESGMFTSETDWYIVTVTDENGCTATDSIYYDASSFGLQVTEMIYPSCSPDGLGSITVEPISADGPVDYMWTEGINSASIFDIAEGNYSVFAIDSAGCGAQLTVTLPVGIQVVIEDITSCFNGENGHLVAQVTGATGAYSITWNGATGGLESTGLLEGNHVVSVTDSSNCSASASYYLGNPQDCFCQGDLNNDGIINNNDLVILMSYFGCVESNCIGDLNEDGAVGASDVLILNGLIGTSCY